MHRVIILNLEYTLYEKKKKMYTYSFSVYHAELRTKTCWLVYPWIVVTVG
jgi:hypothetical protein